MLSRRAQSVADEVLRRLMTGDEDQDAQTDQLLRREAVAFLLGDEQGAQQVVPRIVAALVDEAHEVQAEVRHGADRLVQCVQVGRRGRGSERRLRTIRGTCRGPRRGHP